MRFQLKGEIIFEAESFDDAFKKLEDHFHSLRTVDRDVAPFEPGTDIHLVVLDDAPEPLGISVGEEIKAGDKLV